MEDLYGVELSVAAAERRNAVGLDVRWQSLRKTRWKISR